jgi:hypothetical protein
MYEIMSYFPDVSRFEINQDGTSGIGTVTTMTMFAIVNGNEGKFTVEISGTENW